MAHEIYLKLKGEEEIKGEATSKAYKDHIVLDDFSYSIEAASPDGRGSGSPTMSQLEINKHMDKSSPKFALAAFNRVKFKEATIYLCKVLATGKSKNTRAALECSFKNLTCLGYDFTGQDHATEKVNFKYEVIDVKYTSIDPTDLVKEKMEANIKLDRKKNEGSS